MAISGLNNIYGNNRLYENLSAVKKREKSESQKDISISEMKERAGWNTDSVEISPEGLWAAERELKTQTAADSGLSGEAANSELLEEEIQANADPDISEEEIREAADSDTSEETETTDHAAETSEGSSGKVAVNEGKRARQIAAAKNQAQVQQVLALLRKISDCKAGKEKGWCDDSEIAKVEALISQAQARMSQVPRESDQDDQGGLDAFAMASLM